MTNAGLDELINSIAAAKGTDAESVRKLVKDKQAEFSGLLTEKGAAQLLAQEAGVEAASDNNDEDASAVVPLADAMEQADVFVRVVSVFAPKGFEKNGRKGRVCNVQITDGKTKASLVLWNRDVDASSFILCTTGAACMSAVEIQ